MTHNIPGRRPRSSSLGDALDIEDVEEYPHRPLSKLHRQVSQSLHLDENTDSEKSFPDSNENSVEDKCKTLPSKSKRRSKPSFKSVKNLMSRLIRTTPGPPVNQNRGNNVYAGGKGGMARNESSRSPEFSPERFSDDRPLQMSHGRDRFDSASRPLLVDVRAEETPGIVGIYNHGNTCFMNAILQCLSNTDSFAEYFVTKQHKKDDTSTIARRLGITPSKNDMIDQLGHLLTSLWSDRYSRDVSSAFKGAVGRSKDQYKGSSQHDAQEFLLWLLDRVNEDLSVNSKKKHKMLTSKVRKYEFTDLHTRRNYSNSYKCISFRSSSFLY